MTRKGCRRDPRLWLDQCRSDCAGAASAAPGETVLGGDYALLPGGKGANQALAARRAGAEVAMTGAVGHDAFAAIALDPLRRAGIDTRLVQRRAADRLCGDHGCRGRREHDRGRPGRQCDGARRPGARRAARPGDDPRRPDGGAGRRDCGGDPARAGARRIVLLNLAPALPIDPTCCPRSMCWSPMRARRRPSAPSRRVAARLRRGLCRHPRRRRRRGLSAPTAAASPCRRCRSTRSTRPAPATPLSGFSRRRSMRRAARGRIAAGERGGRSRLSRPRRPNAMPDAAAIDAAVARLSWSATGRNPSNPSFTHHHNK